MRTRPPSAIGPRIKGATKWLAAVAIAAAALPPAAYAQTSARDSDIAARAKPDQIDINYVEPETADHQFIYRLVRERQGLEKIRDLLRPLRLPHRLLLETRGCDGMSNAFSNEESVIVCYEFLDEIWKNASAKTTPAGISPIDTLIGPFVDVFLHEAGHAVFRALKIPLFGREEDAADQFSTYIMLRFDKEQSRRLILGSAYQYKADLSSPTATKWQEFADAHGTPAQRFFNLLCLAYGADPELFGDLVEKGFLPKERTVTCADEYLQVSHAFETLIRPHIDPGLAQQLHKQWLPPPTMQKPKR
jgi:hypothetical protein